MRAVDVAWAAGVFEGEGSIGINTPTKRNLGHLYATVVNTDSALTDFFQLHWPGYCRRTHLPGNRRPATVWTIAARRAAGFLQMILPYVRRPIVRERIALALQYQDGKRHGRARPVSREYREDQFSAWLYMRQLNIRGVDAPEFTPLLTAARFRNGGIGD